MKNSRLIDYFRTLEKSEIKEFGRFLRSDYLNRDPHIIRLYEYVRKFYPDYKAEGLGKELVHKKIFPGLAYQVRRINDVMSDLSKKLETFFVHVEAKNGRLEQTQLLIKAMRRRELDKHFKRFTKKALDYLENKPERDMFYYYNRIKLNHELNASLVTQAPSKNKNSVGNLDILFNDLDKFYVLAKLRYYYEFLLSKRHGNSEYRVLFLDELMQISASDVFDVNPIFQIYKLSIEQNIKPTEENYWKLKELIFENLSLGNEEEKRTFMDLLINSSAQVVWRGSKYYGREIFDLYKFRLKKNILVEDGYFSESHFLNIVNVSCALGEYKFVKNFIPSYKGHLKVTDPIVPICVAKVNFTEGKYDEAVNILLRVNTDHYRHETGRRVLLIKCNYEQGDVEMIIRECDGFDGYLNRLLRRGAISQMVFDVNKNFITMVRQLSKFKEERKSKAELLKLISDKPNIADKIWLKGNIDKLKK